VIFRERKKGQLKKPKFSFKNKKTFPARKIKKPPTVIQKNRKKN